jgi:hypothetical protein
MTTGLPGSTRLTLCNSEGLGRLEVDLEAFFAFSFDLAEDLVEMVRMHRPSSQKSPTLPVSAGNRRQA